MAQDGKLKILLAQLDFWVGDVSGNAERIIKIANQARDEQGADLAVFPELALTGYPPEDLLLRRGMRLRVEAALKRIREELRGIHVLFGYPEYTEHGTYNAACLIRDGEILGNYRKHRLPNYSVFDEVRYFKIGTESCVVPINGLPIGITVCEDIWDKEPAAAAAAAGAKLLININASPFHLEKGTDRSQALATRAQETGLPILYLNMVGGQDELVFDGESLLCDRSGHIVYRAPAFEEYLPILSFDGNGDAVDLPADITRPLSLDEAAYKALVLGVRDYIERNGFPGAVLGLSGGIDSALVLALAIDAIGPERVMAVMMPSEFTSDMSLEDAEALARRAGVEYHVLPISEPFEAMQHVLQPVFQGLPADITEENLQARCRGILVMAISNKTGKMVLSTGNKSEMAVGYCTLYGDMVGGFAPLKDVSKTWVYRLCHYRNRISDLIPARIIERPPSAELRADQKDTDSLPDYDVLDKILEYHVEQDMPIAEIMALGYDETLVRRIGGMVKRAEYKRRQAPPGVKITRRAFGRDRRYPISSGYV
jgi:NAD+ synthase (glutamine-hydrolysing)